MEIRFSVSRFPDWPGLNDSDRQIEGLEMRLVDVPTDQATREMHGFRVMNWGDILGYIYIYIYLYINHTQENGRFNYHCFTHIIEV